MAKGSSIQEAANFGKKRYRGADYSPALCVKDLRWMNFEAIGNLRTADPYVICRRPVVCPVGDKRRDLRS
ncbi:hypothetical protein J6590_024740 [Homalodisca vitripennis]|nr:hypothetical protein J6590_024740 [Homalodisca vitripennis]